MRNFYLLLLLIPLILLTGCRQPVKSARAYAIQSAADQAALDRESQRRYSKAIGEIQLAERQATSNAKIAARENFIWWSSLAGVVAVVVLILSFAGSLSYTAVGYAQAVVKQAELNATLVALDKGTRQFPLLTTYVGKGRFAVHNPNTGACYILDTRQEPDARMIAAAGLTQVSGVIAQEAAKSKEPSGVAMVNPPMVIMDREDVSPNDY